MAALPLQPLFVFSTPAPLLSLPTSTTRTRRRRRLPSSIPPVTAAFGFNMATSSSALLPPQFGYVVLTAAASVALTQWQGIQVSIQRRKAGLKYPKMYEDSDGSVFNCYQRAHQNTLEAYPAFLTLLILGGLGYPVTVSIFGMIWVIGRVFYSLGYYTGDPSKRFKGAWNIFGLLGLLVTTAVYGIRLLTPA